MPQPFFFAVSSKIGNFANQFLDTVLQCCPAIFGRFAHLDAHFFCRFLEFGRGVGNLFEKKQNKSCYFQNVFNFLAADFSLAAGIFYFFRQFSVCFQVFHFIPMDRLRETMWAMNAVDHSTHPEVTTIDTTDEEGNPITTEITETVPVIELAHKTPDEMAADYHFTTRQNTYLQLL